MDPGETVWMKPDVALMVDIQWPVIYRLFRETGVKNVWDPDQWVVIIDHTVQGCAYPPSVDVLHESLREFVKEQGIKWFYDIGYHGIAHQLMREEGHVRPGVFYTNDSPERGEEVMGCLYIGSGTRIFTVLATGMGYWTRPLDCRVNISGSLHKGVMPRDVGDHISGDVGTSGFRLRGQSTCVEVGGTTVDAMDLDERHALLNVIRGGAACSIMNPDQKVIDHISSIAKGPWEAIKSDHDAEYEKVLDYDVSNLEPQVVSGPARAQGAAKPVTEIEGMEINEACIGSCGSGMMPDLRAAVEILKGKKVHEGVRLFITPSTQRIFMKAVREGLIETLLQAGATILTPGCGPCVGYVGQLASGEVAITTHNSNHTGRMGAMDAIIYLASAYTVAASAVEGKITDPRKLL